MRRILEALSLNSKKAHCGVFQSLEIMLSCILQKSSRGTKYCHFGTFGTLGGRVKNAQSHPTRKICMNVKHATPEFGSPYNLTVSGGSQIVNQFKSIVLTGQQTMAVYYDIAVLIQAQI